MIKQNGIKNDKDNNILTVLRRLQILKYHLFPELRDFKRRD